MRIDADHLFQANHHSLVRLATYLGVNPFGLSRRALVLALLFRLVP